MATIPEITDRLEAATEKAENASQIIYDVANGDATTEVPTASGPTPTLKKWFQDLGSAVEPMLAGIPARLDKAILSYKTKTEADTAASGLPNGQQVESPDDNGIITTYYVKDGLLEQNGQSAEFVNVFSFMSKELISDVVSRSSMLDATSPIQQAINSTSENGGGVVWVPSGRYSIGGDIVPADNVILLGSGRDSTEFIVPLGNTTKNTLIVNINPSTPFKNFTIDGISFTGQWLTSQSEVAANGLITLKYITNLSIRNCAFRYSRAFTLNINECNTVVIDNNILEYSPRDMIAVWGTPDVRVTNNILRHNDDDGISINLETPQPNPIRSQIIIVGNLLEDTGPIRTQAPKNVIISKNNIRRSKGAGILLGINNTSTNDTSSGHAISIEGNIITDVIDRQWFVNGTQTGSVNNRIYISIYSIPTQAGSLPVAPGEINTSTGTVQSPYDFYYKKASIPSGVGSIRSPNGVQVKNNICKRTLPEVAAYSDWGYGDAYSKNGFINFAVSDALLRSIGCRVLLPFSNLVIDGNLFESGREGVRFDLQSGVTLSNRLAKRILIKNNQFVDIDTAGINWIPGSLTHQDVTIEDNVFDCDPFFISSNRGAGGTWLSSTGAPTAIRVNQLGSAIIIGNKLRNCASAIEQSGVSGFQYVENNLIFADAAASGFSTSNKGIGNIPAIGDGSQWWIQYEDSDPTSSTYGQSLGANLKNSSSMPSSGKWISTSVVKARTSTVSGSAGSQYVLLGWLRRTTGSSHVVGTDWSEMRCLTGT